QGRASNRRDGDHGRGKDRGADDDRVERRPDRDAALQRALPAARPAGRAPRARSRDRRGGRTRRVRGDARRLAEAAGPQQGTVLPAPVGGQPGPFGAAAPGRRGEARPQGPAGRPQRRARRHGGAGARRRDRGAPQAAHPAARGHRAAILRRPGRGPDRQRDGDRPGRREEPYRPRDGGAPLGAGADDMTDPFDEGFEERLRAALRAEADSVEPSPEALATIRERTERRGRTGWLGLPWLRPALAVGAAAAIAGTVL